MNCLQLSLSYILYDFVVFFANNYNKNALELMSVCHQTKVDHATKI